MTGRRLAAGDRLVLATHNAGKLRELAALLAPRGVVPVAAADLGLEEPAETEASFTGNARIKAQAAAAGSGLPALADDSGFSVAALGGDPGVRTADWATRPDGRRDYAQAMATVARLATARDQGGRGAWFTCALVLAWPDGAAATFEGRVEGTWVWPPRGDHGFGFDPMFVPAGGAATFAQLPPAAKHAIGHRARAFAPLARACLPGAAAPCLGEVLDRLAAWAAGVPPLRAVRVGGHDPLAGEAALPVALELDAAVSAADALVWQGRCAAELADLSAEHAIRLQPAAWPDRDAPILATRGKVACAWAGR